MHKKKSDITYCFDFSILFYLQILVYIENDTSFMIAWYICYNQNLLYNNSINSLKHGVMCEISANITNI